MSDYNFENIDSCISKYYIKNNKIVIMCVNNTEIQIPYTKEAEQQVLIIMNKEAQEELKKTDLIDKKLEKTIIWLLLLLGSFLASTLNIINGVVDVMELNRLALIISGVGSLSTLLKTINLSLTSYDIKKKRLLLENQELLNQNIQNEKSLVGVSDKTRDYILQQTETMQIFNINMIDYMSLNDLKKLKKNIDSIVNNETISNELESKKVYELK